MVKELILGLALCAWPAPLFAAQDSGSGAEAAAPPQASKPEAQAAAAPPQPGKPARPKFWFQTDVAPEIVQQEPFSSDPTSSDSTDVKWTLGMNYVLSPFDIEATAGPSATVDSDGDSSASSRFTASVRFRTVDPVLSSREGSEVQWGVRPFVKYSAGLRYAGFFGDRDGTEHTFDAGLALQVKFPGGVELKVDLLPRRLESTLAGGDFTAFRLNPRLTVPLVGNSVDLSLIGDAEHRRYDDVDPGIGRARRDWRLQLFAGLNFANAINNYLDLPIVQDFSVGARLIEIDSNVGSQNRSTLKFAGSVSVRISLN